MKCLKNHVGTSRDLSKILKEFLMEIVQNSERILREIVQNSEGILREIVQKSERILMEIVQNFEEIINKKIYARKKTK